MMTNLDLSEWTTLDITAKNKIIKDALVENLCIVAFTKVDGEVRVMPCTLMPSMLPEVVETDKPVVVKEKKPDTLRVWCTDIKAWRSFRVDNVTEVELVANEQAARTSWVLPLEEDPENPDDLVLTFPEDLMKSQGWEIGDTLIWDFDEITKQATLTKKHD
jgi:hypothetical protein